MSTEQDITTFSHGEDIIIEVFAKDDDGAVLASPNDETIRLNIATSRSAAASLTADGPPQVTLTSAVNAHWTIRLDAVDDLEGVITPGRAYLYSIWSINSVTGVTYEQARGRLVYAKSVGPFV